MGLTISAVIAGRLSDRWGRCKIFVYLAVAVDLALVTDVLPDSEHAAAKDLDIFNIANALPQSVAPAIAPFIIAVGDYTLLFAVATILALVGAAFIVPIKAVR